MGYQHLEIEEDGHIATLWLNRPEKRNAMSKDMWVDIPKAMADLDADKSVRVVVLAGRGPAFSVGIDISMLAGLQPEGDSQAASSLKLYDTIRRLQETNSVFARSSKPVIAAVHGYCLGEGINLVAACDIRLASSDAVFSIRETRLGIVADVGALQRLPGIIGSGHLAELAFTGKDIDATRARGIGLVNDVYPDHASLMKAAYELAGEIAANSPLTVSGVKKVLAANDGRTVDEALDYVAQWNSSFLMSNDLMEAISAFIEKREPDFKGN
jgi:enoyl-CoA hydratase/carnithine racemase